LRNRYGKRKRIHKKAKAAVGTVLADKHILNQVYSSWDIHGGALPIEKESNADKKEAS